MLLVFVSFLQFLGLLGGPALLVLCLLGVSLTVLIGAKRTAEQQPIRTAIGRALYSALTSA
jgi:hypothetical protein